MARTVTTDQETKEDFVLETDPSGDQFLLGKPGEEESGVSIFLGNTNVDTLARADKGVASLINQNPSIKEQFNLLLEDPENITEQDLDRVLGNGEIQVASVGDLLRAIKASWGYLKREGRVLPETPPTVPYKTLEPPVQYNQEVQQLFDSHIDFPKRTAKQHVNALLGSLFDPDRFVLEYLDQLQGIKITEEAKEGLKFEGEFLKGITFRQNPKLPIIGRSGVSPYINFSQLSSTGDVIRYVFERGTVKFTDEFRNLERSGPGLVEVLEDLPRLEEVGDFFNYLAALRTKHLYEKRGIVTPMAATEKDRRALDMAIAYGNSNPRFQAVREAYNLYDQRIMGFGVQTGILSREGAARFTIANPDFVPLYRIDIDPLTGKYSLKASSKAPITGIKGMSKEDIAAAEAGDPSRVGNILGNVVKNNTLFIDMGLKNRALQSLFDMIDDWALKDPIGSSQFAIKVVDKKELAKYHADRDEIINKLKAENGGEAIDLSNVPDGMVQLLAFDKFPNRYNLQVVLRDGEPQYYRIVNPLLFDSLQTMGPRSGSLLEQSRIYRALKTAKNIYTGLITKNPEFAFYANPIRDLFVTPINTAAGQGFFKRPIEGNPLFGTYRMLMHNIKEDPDVIDYFLNGGGFSSLYHGNIEANRKLIQNYYKGLISDNPKYERTLGVAGKNVILSSKQTAIGLARWYDNVVAGFEQGPRYNENRLAREYLGASKREGAYLGGEVSVDFRRKGANATLQMLTGTIPFSRPALLGVYKSYKVAKADFWRTMGRMGLYVGAPSAFLWLMNHDNPDYIDQPDNLKMTHNFLNVGTEIVDGKEVTTWLLAPLPHDYGMVANFTRNVLDTMFTDYGKDFTEAFIEQAILLSPMHAELPFAGVEGTVPIPLSLPIGIQPPGELVLNRSTFTGREVIPESLQGVRPRYQHTFWTSTTMIELSKKIRRNTGIDLSPMKLEYLFVGYMGTLGSAFIDMSDRFVEHYTDEYPERPSGDVIGNIFGIEITDDMLGVRRGIRKGVPTTTKTIADIYEEYIKLSVILKEQRKLLTDAQNTLAEGDLEEWMKDPQAQMALRAMPILSDFISRMADINKRIATISQNPDMSSDEKKKRIDTLRMMKITISRQISDPLNELLGQTIEAASTPDQLKPVIIPRGQYSTQDSILNYKDYE